MIYKSDISSLKKDMEDKIGQKIIVKESPGKRSKPLEKPAIIEQVYPTYFRVKKEEVLIIIQIYLQELSKFKYMKVTILEH